MSVLQSSYLHDLLCSVFIECVDGTGTIEWNAVSNTLVAFHANAVGQITMSPANDRAFVVDGDSSIVNVLLPTSERPASLCPILLVTPGASALLSTRPPALLSCGCGPVHSQASCSVLHVAVHRQADLHVWPLNMPSRAAGNAVPAAGPYPISVPGNPANPTFYSNFTALEGIDVRPFSDHVPAWLLQQSSSAHMIANSSLAAHQNFRRSIFTGAPLLVLRRLLCAQAYTVYFPLTRITNVNNIAAAAAAGSSVLAPGYFNQPSDCSYATSVSTQSIMTNENST